MKLFVCFIFLFGTLHAQLSKPISSSDYGSLINGEKKLQRIAKQYMADSVESVRFDGARKFIKELVQTLKTPNSFNYHFDSLRFLANIAPEDSLFRILTFRVMLDDFTYRHYGCIQFNSTKLKLIPFNDFSDTFPLTPQKTITSDNWFGSIYYKCITKEVNGEKVYFLVGYDENDLLSDKKIIDPLWFDKGQAMFGAPYFQKTIETKSGPKTTTFYRYVIEYRSKAKVSVNYMEPEDMIVYDHLTPLDRKGYEAGFMLVPDGSLEGLIWKKNKWVWEEYIKLTKNETNEPIRPVPARELQLKSE